MSWPPGGRSRPIRVSLTRCHLIEFQLNFVVRGGGGGGVRNCCEFSWNRSRTNGAICSSQNVGRRRGGTDRRRVCRCNEMSAVAGRRANITVGWMRIRTATGRRSDCSISFSKKNERDRQPADHDSRPNFHKIFPFIHFDRSTASGDVIIRLLNDTSVE